MTDQLDPQFQMFSEMLDNEEALGESSVSVLGQDGALLLALREQLRAEPSAPPLPQDYARTTAARVQERYAALPSLTRGLVAWEPVLRAQPFSKRGLPWLFAASLLGLGAGAVSWKAVGLLGLLVLVPGLAANVLYKKRLPFTADLPEVWDDTANPKLSGLFYLIPSLAVLATSALAGRALAALGTFSLSFQANSTNLQLAALAGVLVVFTWLYNALWPLWRAYEEATRGHAIRTFFVQWLHGIWLLLAGFFLLDLAEVRIPWAEPFLLGLTVVAVIITGLLSRRRAPASRLYSLPTAFKRSFTGFLVGFVPIVLVFVVFYQASMTRETSYPAEYQNLRSEVEKWAAFQKSVAPEENGMTELEPILFNRDGEPREAAALAMRLKAGADLLDAAQGENVRTTDPNPIAHLNKVRQEFLQELPRIRAAVDKPHFASKSHDPLNLGARAPDFILCRAISQALEGLVLESLEAGDTAAALDYQRLNLRWATKFREGVLINLMINLAMNRIAVGSVERMILEGGLTDQQLRELAATLKETEPDRMLFAETMNREIYAIDDYFQELASPSEPLPPGYRQLDDLGLQNVKALGFVPRSYWESERNVYLNIQLAQAANWVGLGRPSDTELVDIVKMLPWSVAAQGLVPNLSRAQVQFMVSLSRYSALRLQVALELYHREHGVYPAKLEALVPEYLEAVPVDAMHSNLWKRKEGFAYRLEGTGYRLVSESPLYERVTMKNPQVYGHDGDYNEGL
jgi:hypothetical protein